MKRRSFVALLVGSLGVGSAHGAGIVTTRALAATVAKVGTAKVGTDVVG